MRRGRCPEDLLLSLSFVSEVAFLLLVRLQVGQEDDAQLAVMILELLRIHQQTVSGFRWCLAYPHADLHIIVKFLNLPVSRISSLGVPMRGWITACNFANRGPAVLGAWSATSSLQASSPFLSCILCASLRHHPEVSDVPQGLNDQGCLVGVGWTVHCGLYLCVEKVRRVSLVDESETVLLLDRNSCKFPSSMSSATSLAASCNIAETRHT